VDITKLKDKYFLSLWVRVKLIELK
jgi:hypothetical protein